MVPILTRLIGTNLFLQLSYSLLVVGITTRTKLGDSSISPYLGVEKALFAVEAHDGYHSSRRSSSSSPLEARGLNCNGRGLQATKKVDNAGIRGYENGNEKYEKAMPAADGVVPLGWEENQMGRRRYLPPVRVAESYGPSGVIVGGDDVVQGSPLPPKYSSESWNCYWKIRADRQRVETENGHAIDQPPGIVLQATTNHRDVASLQDTKPVYEFINDEFSSSYELTNDQPDYKKLHGPKGNRAEQQSTDPNTVTQHATHRLPPTKQPHEFSISRDTTSRHESASLFIPDWFSTYQSYNTPIHPPLNPVISLLLSHYGRYLSGTHQPRIYSYMAVNNIHNNRPFGQYKLACDE